MAGFPHKYNAEELKSKLPQSDRDGIQKVKISHIHKGEVVDKTVLLNDIIIMAGFPCQFDI